MTNYSIVYPQQEGLYYGVERVEGGSKEVIGYYKDIGTAEAVCGALANESYRQARTVQRVSMPKLVQRVEEEAREGGDVNEIVENYVPVYYQELADLLALNPGLGFDEDGGSAFGIISRNVWEVLMDAALAGRGEND